MKNRKSLMLLLLVLGGLFIIGGVSYAFFNYSRIGSQSELVTGNIYLNYIDGAEEGITLTNAFPEKRKEARSRLDNTIEFTIEGINGSNNDIYYEIDLVDGDDVSGKTRLQPNELKFDLYEVVDGEEDKLLIGDLSFDSFNNQKIWVDTISVGGHYNYDFIAFDNYYAIDRSESGVQSCKDVMSAFANGDYSDDNDGYEKVCHNEGKVMGMTVQELFNAFGSVVILDEFDFINIVDEPGFIKETNNYSKDFKLRMWIDENVMISDTNDAANYKTDEWEDMFGSIKVRVIGDFDEKESPYAFMINGSDFNEEIMDIIDENVTKLSFIKLSKNELDSRYNAATNKADVTRDENAINKIYAFVEDDELIVASDKLIVFPELCGSYFTIIGNGMLEGLHYIETISFNNSNTSQVRDFSHFFGECSNLRIININSIDTYNAEYLMYMFGNCSSLASLDLSNFDTSNVTNMSKMFSRCSDLISLDLTNFDTSNVTNMSFMFSSCSSLTSLDLSSFDTSNVTNMYDMFYECSNLASIYVDDTWSIENTDGSDMFYKCSALVGGNGTAYDSSHLDESYAHVDTAGNPGYLTLKS